AEPASIHTLSPVSNLADLKGKQLSAPGSLAYIYEEMGAAPVAMPISESQEALQTGVIEGMISSREVFKDFKIESLEYTTDYPLSLVSFVGVMNKDVWDSLPAEVQEVIDELSLEMVEFTGEYHDKQIEESLDWAKDK